MGIYSTLERWYQNCDQERGLTEIHCPSGVSGSIAVRLHANFIILSFFNSCQPSWQREQIHGLFCWFIWTVEYVTRMLLLACSSVYSFCVSPRVYTGNWSSVDLATIYGMERMIGLFWFNGSVVVGRTVDQFYLVLGQQRAIYLSRPEIVYIRVGPPGRRAR